MTAPRIDKRFPEIQELVKDHQWRTLEQARAALNYESIECAPYLRHNVCLLVGLGTFDSRINPDSGEWEFRLKEDVQASAVRMSSLPTGKCQYPQCYEPAACKHGMCHEHCSRHTRGSYGDRKYPTSQEPHIGVEVEVNFPDSTSFRRGVGLDNSHSDGSLGTYGAEYKTLSKSKNAAEEVAELVKELWTRKARVDRSCGLHVHLDVRQITSARVAKLLEWCYKTQEVWFSLMPPSRKTNHFCQMLDESLYTTHYSWVNKTHYNTIEFRLHGGTLNPFKVAGWITALAHVQKKVLDVNYQFPNTGDAEADFWALFADCKAEGKDYLATRKAMGGVVRDIAFNHVEE